MIVADTNLIAYLFIEGHTTEVARTVFVSDNEWVAPYLWRSEFRNVLALYIRQKLIMLDTAKELMTQAENLMLDHEFEVNSSDVLDLAKMSACSAYDCEFVALAKELSVKIVTSDKKLIAAFPAVAVSMDSYPLSE